MKHIMCNAALSSAFVVILADELWKEMPYHYTAERQHDNREKSHAEQHELLTAHANINLSVFTIYTLYFHIEKNTTNHKYKNINFGKHPVGIH